VTLVLTCGRHRSLLGTVARRLRRAAVFTWSLLAGHCGVTSATTRRTPRFLLIQWL